MKKVKILPPHSREAEMTVLGAMLSSFNCLNVGCDELEIEDFYFSEHQKVFKAMKEIHASENSADVLIVSEVLKKHGTFEKVGGSQFLDNLSNFSGLITNIEEYTEILREKFILRRIMLESHNLYSEVSKDNQSAENLLEAAQKAFFEISNHTRKDTLLTTHDIFSGNTPFSSLPFMKEIEEKQTRFEELGREAAQATGLPTGFGAMDKILHGLNPSNLIVIAARPAMGKTQFALNIARYLSVEKKVPGLIFSLEMDAMQLFKRLVSSEAEINADKVVIGDLSGDDYQNVFVAAKKVADAPICIDDFPGLKITDLRARARRYKEIYHFEYIIVDYLQLISGSGKMKSNENRQLEVSEISRMLKILARELHVPIICLSQLSRKVEDRVSKRPMLSDLRESGAIEQDSDQILFLLREDYYDAGKKPGLLDVIVAKNRHGKTEDFEVVFFKDTGRMAAYFPFEEESSPQHQSFMP